MLSITLVEEHVFIDAVKQISRSYESNIETMIQSIVEGDLGKPIVKNRFSGSAQGIRRVIVPYLSPLQAVYWLKDRATNKIGAPIFVYGDLYSQNVVISDLEGLMREEPVNKSLPFYFSDAIATGEETYNLPRDYYEIKSYTEKNMENSMQLYEQGAIGSYYETLDAGTGQKQGAHISVRDIVEEMGKKKTAIDMYRKLKRNLEGNGYQSDMKSRVEQALSRLDE